MAVGARSNHRPASVTYWSVGMLPRLSRATAEIAPGDTILGRAKLEKPNCGKTQALMVKYGSYGFTSVYGYHIDHV